MRRTTAALALLVSATASTLGAGCATPHTLGNVSAVAAPIPVLFGPVNCIGTCATPAAKVAYGNDLVVVTGATLTTSDTTTSHTAQGTKTKKTTTTTSELRGAGTNAVYPLLAPVLRLPFSKRSVAHLDGLEMGRRYDEVGKGSDHSSTTTTLTMGATGHFYGLPAPAASAAPPRTPPPPDPPAPPPSPEAGPKKPRRR
jgi:hypothetical protein